MREDTKKILCALIDVLSDDIVPSFEDPEFHDPVYRKLNRIREQIETVYRKDDAKTKMSLQEWCDIERAKLRARM